MELLDAQGWTRAHLVGHSLGSATIMQLALTWPERVASLVAVGPAWVDGMPEELTDYQLHLRLHQDPNLLDEALRMMAPGVPRDERWAQLVHVASQQRRAATEGALRALIRWRPGDRLAALTMPRVVVNGQQDPLCGGHKAARAAAAMGCEHIELPGVGHSPNLEAPEQVAELVARVVKLAEA